MRVSAAAACTLTPCCIARAAALLHSVVRLNINITVTNAPAADRPQNRPGARPLLLFTRLARSGHSYGAQPLATATAIAKALPQCPCTAPLASAPASSVLNAAVQPSRWTTPVTAYKVPHAAASRLRHVAGCCDANVRRRVAAQHCSHQHQHHHRSLSSRSPAARPHPPPFSTIAPAASQVRPQRSRVVVRGVVLCA